MHKAIFLDRDGTLIEENGYICELPQSAIYPFTAEAIRRMRDAGFLVFGITNQSAIARGICTKAQVEKIHRDITGILRKEGAVMEHFYYSPYHPEFNREQYEEKSHWRKPEPGMLRQAAADYNIDLTQSYMIGDSPVDIEAGKNAGCRTVLVLTGKGKESLEILNERNIQPDIITENILTAIEIISAATGHPPGAPLHKLP